jgi:hypothetical protein
MALSVYKDSFAANTSTGNQAITGVGFTPKALIVWGTTQTATGYAAGLHFFFGVATSSTTSQQWCIASAADDNIANSNAGGSGDVNSLLTILSNGTPTVDAVATLSSFDSDGFTINWSNAPGSAWIIHYLALGGSDITNAKAGTFDMPATNTAVAVTDPGFQPDFLLVGTQAATAGIRTGTHHTIGMASSTTERGAISWAETDGAANTTAGIGQRTNLLLPVISTGGSYNWNGDLTSFDANGFTITFTANPGAARPAYYLALEGGNYFVGSDTAKITTTGTKATTGVGFQPTGLLSMSWNQVASSSIDTSSSNNMKASYFASDGTREGGVWVGSDDAASTMETNKRTVTDKALGMSTWTATTNAEADLSSFDSDGFTLNWTTVDATAREFIFVAFGSAGTLATQAVTATASGAASVVQRAGKILNATASGTASLVRQAQKVVSASGVGAASLVRRAAIIHSATATGTASLTSVKTILQAISATATGTASAVLQAGKAITAAGTGTASLVRQPNKLLSATGSGAASFIRSAAYALSATVTGTADLLKSPLISISATATGSASLIRQAGKVASATASAAASLVRDARTTISASASGAASLVRTAAMTLSASAIGTASQTAIKIILTTISATATGTASFLRDADLTISSSATGSAVLSSVKTILSTISATATGAASFIRDPNKIVSATATGTGALLTTRVVLQTISAISTGVASLVRDASKTFSASATGTAIVSTAASLFRTLEAVATGTPSAILFITKSLSAAATGLADLVAEPIVSLYYQTITATANTATFIERQAQKVLTSTAVGTAVVTILQSIFRTITAVASGSASVTKSVIKVLTASASGLASLVTEAIYIGLRYATVTGRAVSRLGTQGRARGKVSVVSEAEAKVEVVSSTTDEAPAEVGP